MSIDIKTLRIGSHVSVDCKRVSRCGITKRKIGYHHPNSRPDAHLRYARIHEVEPISLTPELLTEIGFKWRETAGSLCRYQNYDGENYDWGIYICYSEERGCMISLCLKDYRLRPQLYAKYLHELEGQLAYYGVELIPD